MPAEHLHADSHLTTALTGPLQQIETLLLTEPARIETWLRGEWRKTSAPLYTSVDLRSAGFKLAPVDTNLVPTVFNLKKSFQPRNHPEDTETQCLPGATLHHLAGAGGAGLPVRCTQTGVKRMIWSGFFRVFPWQMRFIG